MLVNLRTSPRWEGCRAMPCDTHRHPFKIRPINQTQLFHRNDHDHEKIAFPARLDRFRACSLRRALIRPSRSSNSSSRVNKVSNKASSLKTFKACPSRLKRNSNTSKAMDLPMRRRRLSWETRCDRVVFRKGLRLLRRTHFRPANSSSKARIRLLPQSMARHSRINICRICNKDLTLPLLLRLQTLDHPQTPMLWLVAS